MSNPLVSLIVPMYNVEPYVSACLESVVGQTYRRLQVVVVDDGSTDRSPAIAVGFESRDERVTVVRQDNAGPGPGGGRNGGLHSATGELIMFVDADDVLARDCVELLVAAIDLDGAENDMATIGVAYLRDDRQWPSALHEHSHAVEIESTTLAATPVLAADTTPWNKLFRREFFDRTVGEWPARVLYEDTEPMTRCHVASTGTAVVAGIGYYWRQRSTGTSITQQSGSLDPVRAQLEATTRALDVLERENGAAFEELSWRLVSVDLAWMSRQLGGFGGRERGELIRLLAAMLDRVDPAALAAVNDRLGVGYELIAERRRASLATWFAKTRLVLFPDGRSLTDARRFDDPLWSLRRRRVENGRTELTVSPPATGRGDVILRPFGADLDTVTANMSSESTLQISSHELRSLSTRRHFWFIDLADLDQGLRGPLRRSRIDIARSRLPLGAGDLGTHFAWSDGRLIVDANHRATLR